MVKSHSSKRHYKKHRGGEGEDNSVLNMDEPASASASAMPAADAMPADAMPETASAAPESAMPESASASAAPAEEEKKGWFNSLFGGSKTKHVRFRTTRKHKRSGAKRSSAKRSSAKRSGVKSKRSGAKRSSAKRTHKKRKGSSKK